MPVITIDLPEEIASPVEELSRRIGVPPRELVLSALRAHFMVPEGELRDELDAWELAAGQDAAQFESVEERGQP